MALFVPVLFRIFVCYTIKDKKQELSGQQQEHLNQFCKILKYCNVHIQLLIKRQIHNEKTQRTA